MFPHVWNAVNINIKPKPRMITFNSFLPSGPILEKFFQEVTAKKKKSQDRENRPEKTEGVQKQNVNDEKKKYTLDSLNT